MVYLNCILHVSECPLARSSVAEQRLIFAFATVGQRITELFKAFARMAERRLDEFNAQGLANTAWAFATVNQQDAQLFAALARTAERRLE